uniref:Uncharacterized protein n=1 Tax=Acrobeloides nanus TaxID=290746 RepID=A0A914C9K8_9BILA
MTYKSKVGYTERGDGFYTSEDTDSSDGGEILQNDTMKELVQEENDIEKPHSILDYLDVIDATKKVSFLLGIRRPVLSEKRQALEVLLFDLENPRVFCYHSGYKTTIEILLKILHEEKDSFEIMAVVVKCLTHLAIRMQKKFAPYVKPLVQTMYQQFQGKLLHPILVECINSCNGFFDLTEEKHSSWQYRALDLNSYFEKVQGRVLTISEYHSTSLAREQAFGRLKKRFQSLCADENNNKAAPRMNLSPAFSKFPTSSAGTSTSKMVFHSNQVSRVSMIEKLPISKTAFNTLAKVEIPYTEKDEEIDLKDEETEFDSSIKELVQSMFSVLK